MSRTIARFSFVVVAALCVWVPSAAAANPCVHKGETYRRVGGALAVRHDFKKSKKWPNGITHVYACSATYGKRVFIGIDGERYADQGYSVSTRAGNARYAAAVIGGYGAVDGWVSRVVVADLKRGRIVTNAALPEPTYDWRYGNLQNLALSAKGVLGLIVYDISKPEGGRMFVRRIRPGGSTEVVTSGPDSIGPYLRFGADQKTLVWSTAINWMADEPKGINSPIGRGKGRCMRKGDKLVHRELGQMLMRHPVKNGYELYACSFDYKKRIKVGTFLRCIDGCIRPSAIAIDPYQVAIATRTTSSYGKIEKTDLKFVSLVDGRVFFSGPVSDSDPAARPARLFLVQNGVLAWTAASDIGGAPIEVHLCDAGDHVVLDSGRTIDPGFLDIGSVYPPGAVVGLVRLTWATGTASG